MTCHVRKWMAKKTFGDDERDRIERILYEWGFHEVVRVRYKATTDTIVVWPVGNWPAAQVFIKDKGETLYYQPPLTLNIQ